MDGVHVGVDCVPVGVDSSRCTVSSMCGAAGVISPLYGGDSVSRSLDEPMHPLEHPLLYPLVI